MMPSEDSSNSGQDDYGTDEVLAKYYTVSEIEVIGNGQRLGKCQCYRKTSKKPQRYDPFLMREKSNLTTSSGAFLHLIKSSLGSGILAMPNAFKNGGLIFSLVGTVAVGILCTHCIYLLVLCSQTLSQRIRKPALGYADTAAAAFSTGPKRFRAWASFAREFVNAALFCTYYFGGSVYIVLAATSFKQVVETHTPSEWHCSVRVWILGLVVPLLPLGIIRSLKVLVPFSAIATLFILVGLGCTVLWMLIGTSPIAFAEAATAAVPLPDIHSRAWIAPLARMPLFFTTVLFAMEGIGTILPIENSMSYPKQFINGRPFGVLYMAMTLIVFLFLIVGFLGYLRFGDATEGSITLNLPNDLFAEAVKMMVALSILFSYGLQFCVPSEIVWNRLEPWLRKRRPIAVRNDNETPTVVATTSTDGATSTESSAILNDDLRPETELDQHGAVVRPLDKAYYVMRATMILGTVFIAGIVPDLKPFISLIGAVFFSILGLLCPAVIHMATFWEHPDLDDDDPADLDTECDSNCLGEVCATDDNEDSESMSRLQRSYSSQSSENLLLRKRNMSRLVIAKDVVIVLLALLALVTGTYVSLMDIMAFYNGKHNNNSTITTNFNSDVFGVFLA